MITHVNQSTPLRVFVFHGMNRATSVGALQKYDVVITTYATLGMEYKKALSTPGFYEGAPNNHPQNPSLLHRIHWYRVVLDEAHGIKEPSTLQAKAVHALDADRRWCITGTPLVCSIVRLLPSHFSYFAALPSFSRTYHSLFLRSPHDNAAKQTG